MAMNFTTNFSRDTNTSLQILDIQEKFYMIKKHCFSEFIGFTTSKNCSVHLFYSRTHKMEPSK